MKRLVLCADGTWNSPEKEDRKLERSIPTNVIKTARAILPRVVQEDGTTIEQVVYYHPGVGTHLGFDSIRGGAFGHGLMQNVRALYRFLCLNFEPGDQIYMFGFSRGAYTVRVLAGFMNQFGLLQKDDEYFTNKAFECYAEGKPVATLPQDKATEKLKLALAAARPCPDITFLGVWDTVGSLGAPGYIGRVFNRKQYANLDVSLNDHIQHAAHACAIDEYRKPFFLTTFHPAPSGWSGQLEEVWFSGSHSDVGGGVTRRNPNIALHWMLQRAENHGLQFDTVNYLTWYKCWSTKLKRWYQHKLTNSLTWFWLPLGKKPRDLTSTGATPTIHESVLERYRDRDAYTQLSLKSVVASRAFRQVTTPRRV